MAISQSAPLRPVILQKSHQAAHPGGKSGLEPTTIWYFYIFESCMAKGKRQRAAWFKNRVRVEPILCPCLYCGLTSVMLLPAWDRNRYHCGACDSPDWYLRCVRPRCAPTVRDDRNLVGSSMADTKVNEISAPTPGTVISRCARLSSLAFLITILSRWRNCSTNVARALSKASIVSVNPGTAFNQLHIRQP